MCHFPGPTLMESGLGELSKKTIMQIKRLADTDGDKKLRLTEFLCAMALVALCKAGAEVPGELPQELIDAAEAATEAALYEYVDSDSDEEADEEEDTASTESAPPRFRLPERVSLLEAEQELDRIFNDPWRPGDVFWLPVSCLRWTHDGIKSNLLFSDKKSLWSDFVYPMWRDQWKWWYEIPPMDVVLDVDGFWCLSNRRLAGFRMVQALSAETVWAKCYLLSPSSKRAKFERSKTTENGGTGVVPNNHRPKIQ